MTARPHGTPPPPGGSPGRGARVDRQELGEATSHGQLYVDRLRAAHLTLSGVALVAFGGLVGALPLVALALPSLEAQSLLGVPLPVLLLLAPYPVFIVIGAVYARRADGLDATFAALVGEGDPDGDGSVVAAGGRAPGVRPGGLHDSEVSRGPGVQRDPGASPDAPTTGPADLRRDPPAP